jgi:hypothetical protein
MREKRNANGILMGMAEAKISLGRPRRSWVNNVEMDFRDKEWGGTDWMSWFRIGTSRGLL